MKKNKLNDDRKFILHESLKLINNNGWNDNLFELIMTRFEKLNPYKGAMKIIFKELQRQPIILKKLIHLDSHKRMNNFINYINIFFIFNN